MLLPYQKRVLDTILGHTSVSNKSCVEIGGVPNHCDIARYLLQNGAEKIVQINNRKDLQANTSNERIIYLPMDARKTNFNNNSFDIIYGASVLEHLLDLETLLLEMHRILKKGGVLCLHGGALWNCCWGHHLWVHVDDKSYEFNGNNPVLDWSHLYMNKIEQQDFLTKETNIPKNHIEKIIHWIYESNEINRLTYEDYINLCKKAPFKTIENINKSWKEPNETVIKKIINKELFRLTNYSVGEIILLLQK